MKKIALFVHHVSASAVAVAATATKVHAVQNPSIPNPTGGTNLGDILFSVIEALLLFAGAVAVLFLIIGGFRYVVSTGNPEQVEGAKKTILYAILGLIIIFVAFLLVKLVQTYLGVDQPFQVRE